MIISPGFKSYEDKTIHLLFLQVLT